ncbi:response regulator transcription factor [Burkholderia gladioli]|uniref:response regulator transcription factor n=1 Tax=Burkholderia gladioli TaxID=28095 RepID=UPI0030CD9F61
MIFVIQNDEGMNAQIAQMLEAGRHTLAYRPNVGAWVREGIPAGALLILVGDSEDAQGLHALGIVRRHVGESVPILFLASGERRGDVIHALHTGADDALMMPPEREEFCARVNALLRRAQITARPFAMADAACRGLAVAPVEPLFTVGDYRIDALSRQIWLCGRRIRLSPKEFDLAFLLFTTTDGILSRDTLLLQLWGDINPSTTYSLSSHIYRLRHKLDIGLRHGVRLRTFYSAGYRLERVPVQASQIAQESESTQVAQKSSGTVVVPSRTDVGGGRETLTQGRAE